MFEPDGFARNTFGEVDGEQHLADVQVFKRLDQQTGIVPLFRQIRRGDFFEVPNKCSKLHGLDCRS